MSLNTCITITVVYKSNTY